MNRIGDWAVPGAPAYRYLGGSVVQSATLVTIVRTTPSQVIVVRDGEDTPEFRHRRDDGREVGNGGHYAALLLHPADDRIKAVLTNQRVAQLRHEVWGLLEAKGGFRSAGDAVLLLRAVADMASVAVEEAREVVRRTLPE